MIGAFRLESQMMPGTGKFSWTGLSSDGKCKEAVDTAFHYMKANGGRISGTISTATRDALKQHYADTYQDAKKQSIANSAGMLYRFALEVQCDDYVVFPSKSDRMINIGQVTSDYYYDAAEHEYAHQRKVKWVKHIPRMQFSQGALYELGAFLSFFVITNYAEEFPQALNKNFKKSFVDDIIKDETDGVTADEIIKSTRDFILKELSKNLKGYDLELFVADLLNAMGYQTKVSAYGGDSGVNNTAYKDELPSRIVVQVKSQDGDIKDIIIQSLKGAMREGDYGLFVSLSNYTKNAQNYLDNTPIIRGINGTELVN